MLRSKILKTKCLILLTQLPILSFILEVKNEITSITNLATNTAVKYKTPKVCNLVKGLTITQKLMKLKKKITTKHDHDKYITTREFNKLT